MEKDSKEEKKIANLLREYSDKRPLFAEYAKSVHFLLENLLRHYNIPFQVVQSRPKELSHLREKLFRKKDWQDKPLLKMSDLAACRVIFYFEEDLYQFAEVLHREFEVVNDENKVSPNEYNARQIDLKLKDNRSNLLEYAKFKGLLCEVQLTTALFHAWSEIQHDIIYKLNKDLLEFDKHTLDYLDKYFKEIMEEYLKEASRGFSFINYEFNRIKKGQVVISPTVIDFISRSSSNNEIFSFLTLLKEYVGKYGNKLPKEYKLIDALGVMLNSAEKNPIVDRPTIFGNLKGITYVDIANEILDILDRYYDVPSNVRLIVRLSRHEELRKKCEEILQRMTTFKICVIEKYGFWLQKSILEFFSKEQPDFKLQNLDIILTAMKPIASLECEDFTMDEPYKGTFKRGYLTPNRHLKEIRSQYFELTKELIKLVKTDANKKKSLTLMLSLAYNLHGAVPENITELLVHDINRIADFLLEYYELAVNTLKNEMEKFTFHIERWSFGNRVIALSKLKEKLNQDGDYQKFKIFFGTDVEFFPNYDFEAAQKFRNEKIAKFVAEIDDNNFKEWLPLIKELSTDHQKTRTFIYFPKFLRELTNAKPDIGLKMISMKELSPFLGEILSGLMDGTGQEEAKKLIIEYAKQDTKQLAVARAFLSTKEYDDELFKEICPSLLKSVDSDVLLKVLQTIVMNFHRHNNHKEKVTEIINKLTALKFYSWSFIYYMSKEYWKEITNDNVSAILGNLKNCNVISFEEEQVLGAVALKNSKAIVQFFYERIQLYKLKKIHEAIPFEFATLNTVLSNSYREILPEIIKWFSKENTLENWYASKLIENIFPSFGSELESFILCLIKENSSNVKIALNILERYEGEPFIHDTVKEIIRNNQMTDELKTRLFIILSEPKGVVSGEYGLLDAYKTRREQVLSWLSDPNADIKKFAKEYIEYLYRVINQEKDRTDKRIAFEKREFDLDRHGTDS